MERLIGGNWPIVRIRHLAEKRSLVETTESANGRFRKTCRSPIWRVCRSNGCSTLKVDEILITRILGSTIPKVGKQPQAEQNVDVLREIDMMAANDRTIACCGRPNIEELPKNFPVTICSSIEEKEVGASSKLTQTRQ